MHWTARIPKAVSLPIAAILFMLGMILGLAIGISGRRQEPVAANVKSQPAPLGIERLAKLLLLKYVRAPKTTEFVGPVSVQRLRNGDWRIDGQIDSQNVHGVYLRSPFSIQAKEAGGDLSPASVQIGDDCVFMDEALRDAMKKFNEALGSQGESTVDQRIEWEAAFTKLERALGNDLRSKVIRRLPLHASDADTWVARPGNCHGPNETTWCITGTALLANGTKHPFMAVVQRKTSAILSLEIDGKPSQ
jgi:hypothetical protein